MLVRAVTLEDACGALQSARSVQHIATGCCTTVSDAPRKLDMSVALTLADLSPQHKLAVGAAASNVLCVPAVDVVVLSPQDCSNIEIRTVAEPMCGQISFRNPVKKLHQQLSPPVSLRRNMHEMMSAPPFRSNMC